MSDNTSEEYTLFEASKRYGFSPRYLSQAILEGKLNAKLTALRHGYKNNGVPVYIVNAEEMQRFKRDFPGYKPTGIGSKQENRKPSDRQRTDEADALALRRRMEIEDRAEAREMGVSYEEYLTYVE